jgi:epoxide hydrolase-like predicted phosphatase
MGIQAVIWDLGGVLVRTEDYAPRLALAQRFGMTLAEIEEFVFSSDSGERAQRGEISVEQHWENQRKALGLSPAELQAFQAEFWGGDRLDAELVAYIRLLRRDFKTGLLSNAFSDLRQVVAETWKFADAFDEMVISAEVGLVKPDPRIYQLAVDRLGVAPADAVFIDDFSRNVEGAQAVGLHAIHFRNPQQARRELEDLLNGSRP